MSVVPTRSSRPFLYSCAIRTSMSSVIFLESSSHIGPVSDRASLVIMARRFLGRKMFF